MIHKLFYSLLVLGLIVSFSSIATAADDVHMGKSITGTLTSTDMLEGSYGDNYKIVESEPDLSEFVGKEVKVEAVVLESAEMNQSIKITKIELAE